MLRLSSSWNLFNLAKFDAQPDNTTKHQQGSFSILIVCQYFFPENFGINKIAAELAARGHEVTVLTGMPNYPSGSFAEGYGGWRVRRERIGQVNAIRVPIISRGQNSRLRLALNYLSYALVASLLAPLIIRRKPDVVLVYQLSPVTSAFPAIVLKLFKKSKILLWVQDIWPESLTATGAVKNRAILAAIRLAVRAVYSASSIIAVQSEAFVEFIRPLAPPNSDIRYLPNTADRLYKPVLAAPNAPERFFFRPGFNIVFAGNLGIAQDLETILCAIELLRDTNLQWVFIGDGQRRRWLEQQIHERGLSHCAQVIGQFPPETMPLFFALADALLVTLRDEEIFALTIPSKIQTYLACGRPILGAVSGEAARILSTSGAGLVAQPNDAVSLAGKARTLAGLPPEALAGMAKASLDCHQREFDRDRWIASLETWLAELNAPTKTRQ